MGCGKAHVVLSTQKGELPYRAGSTLNIVVAELYIGWAGNIANSATKLAVEVRILGRLAKTIDQVQCVAALGVEALAHGVIHAVITTGAACADEIGGIAGHPSHERVGLDLDQRYGRVLAT